MTDLTTTPKVRAAQGDAGVSPPHPAEAHQPAGEDIWERMNQEMDERMDEAGDRDPVAFKAWLDDYIQRACLQH
ncbi:MAG: hypothetical protein ACYCYN_07140 [Solirubrobacteraceae bacterium]